MLFTELGLSAELLRAIDDQGYDQPTPIQEKSIPLIMQGRDLLGAAQTGTGKTAAFTLPLLQRLQATGNPNQTHQVRALVLVPTRELAAQVHESVRTYGRYTNFRSCEIYGGVSINPQISKLRKGVDIVVATPGRLLDHLDRRTVDLSAVEILVLDEADRMLDMGFIHDIKRVMRSMPYKRQTLLFSATFSGEIRALANEFQNSPEAVQAAAPNSTADRVTQIVHPVDRERKREMLSHMIGQGNWQQVLVFTRTKHGANRLSKQLEQDGLKSAAIHGNKSQAARQRALADFKKGDVRVLVATDVAARGLDIDLLPHVVNFDLPNVPEDYIHRIGRTARAGQQGHAVSLVCIDEHSMLRDIERLLKQEIDTVVIEGYEPDPRIQAQPIKLGRSQGRPSHQRQAKKRSSPSRGKPGRSGRPSNNAGSGRSANPGKGAKRNSRSGQGAQASGHSANQNAGNSAGRNEARKSTEGNKPPSRSKNGNVSKAAGAKSGQGRGGRNSGYGNNSNRGNSGGRGRQQGAT